MLLSRAMGTNLREVRKNWAIVGSKSGSWLLLNREDRPLFCIWPEGAGGGWHYRNEWAALTALNAWEGFGLAAPMAGEWMFFK